MTGTNGNLLTLVAFLAVVVLALAGWGYQELVSRGPRARLIARARAAGKTSAALLVAESAALTAPRERANWQVQLGDHLAKLREALETRAGGRGILILSIGAVLATLVGLGGAMFAGLSVGLSILVALALAILTTVLIYRYLGHRFRARFLTHFPDGLDFVTRAVRAGVPVGAAIESGGHELPEPVGSQFARMGAAFKLGADMEDVLEEAAARIRVPEFNFFAVCVLLQRQTGGHLVETLEDLANVIRTRRDLQLKARALSTEGRTASQVIGVIPFASALFFYFLAPDYSSVLYTTETGRTLLVVAGGMLAVGFLIIGKISKLED